MDINSLTGIYNQYLTENAQKAMSSASKAVEKDYSNATDDELMDACKKFESYFLEQCLKEMMKTVNILGEDASSSSTTLVDYYKDELVQKVAENSTESQSLGLAQMLYEQMKRNYEV